MTRARGTGPQRGRCPPVAHAATRASARAATLQRRAALTSGALGGRVQLHGVGVGVRAVRVLLRLVRAVRRGMIVVVVGLARVMMVALALLQRFLERVVVDAEGVLEDQRAAELGGER